MPTVISNDIHKSNVNKNSEKKKIDENRREMAFSFKINNASSGFVDTKCHKKAV